MFKKTLEKIKEYDTIIIHRHKNPDGDALGSQIGLKEILQHNFPSKKIYAVGDGAGRYAFMQGSEMDEVEDGLYSGALAIILDTSAKKLISDERYQLADYRVRIDHHLFCECIAEEEVVQTSFESCAGLIGYFAMTCGLELTPFAAKSIYTGMITDSGRFRYDSTSATTFKVASFLMEQRFSTADIYKNLYADDFKFIQAKARMTLKIEFTKNNVAYTYTDAEEAKTFGLDEFTLSRGLVNVMAEIRGVDVWVGFVESERGVLCELRSSAYNINPIAVKYGGGGHEKASGATVANKQEAMAMLGDLDAVMEGSYNG